MTKHLTGSRRLAIIQRWINGHDDPDWEVLPTRKEGKYIVKQRTQPIRETQKVEESSENSETEKVEETPETEIFQETPKKLKPPKPPKSQNVSQGYDPTINLEILNQLRLLGEEIKNKREKKEQKRLIKEAVNKQIYKPKKYYPKEVIYQQTPNNFQQEQAPEPEPYVEPQPVPQSVPQPVRRRNRIFEDMY